MGRFGVLTVLRGHWKSLSSGENGEHADWPARLIFLGVPGTLAWISVYFQWELKQPGTLLTAVSLLISGALSVFAQMVGLRGKLSEREGEWVRNRREALDETVNHLLTAVVIAIFDAIFLVIGISTGNNGAVSWALAWVPIFLTTYLALLLLACVPKLYAAYTTTYDVPEHLDGHSRNLRPR